MDELKVLNVSKSFGKGQYLQQILQSISYDFKMGKLYAILGVSGSGKSTLLKILAGIERPDFGSVILGDDDITKIGNKRRTTLRKEKISLVFQNFCLIKSFNAVDNICLPYFIRNGQSKRDVILRKANRLLENYAPDIPRTIETKNLSGGQQQRVSILRSIFSNPSIILADEPTGSLDSKNSYCVMKLFRELKEKKCVIIVTHNYQLAIDFADQILLLENGKLHEIKKMAN